MTEGIFSGVNILDFGREVAGPLTAVFLAAHGATVVRVETPAGYDTGRTSSPYKDNKPGINRAGYWLWYHPQTLSLAMNLGHPKAREVIERLVRWADVVQQSFVPGRMDRLGWGYEELVKIKPDIILYRSSNLGQTGRYATQKGYGNQLTGYAGYTYLTGWPDRGSSQPYGAYSDFPAPVIGAAALIAALDYRRKTGKGQYIDVSQLEVSLHFLAPVLLDYLVNGRVQGRRGNRSGYAAPYGAFRCRGDDRWCAIEVTDDGDWQAFVRAIGSPSWTRDARFATLPGRKEHEDELERLVEAWTIGFDAGDVMRRMQEAGIGSGVVQNAEDMANDPYFKSGNGLHWLEHKEAGCHPTIGLPFKLSRTAGGIKSPAPLFGEHTEYVCRQLLGMPQAEFDELLVGGLFG